MQEEKEGRLDNVEDDVPVNMVAIAVIATAGDERYGCYPDFSRIMLSLTVKYCALTICSYSTL